MLHLPLTLVMIDCVAPEMAQLSIDCCLNVCSFDDVLVFSDVDLGRGRYIPTKLGSNREAEEFMWYGVWPHLKTTHALYIQYDSFIIDPTRWRNEFMMTDWIGAPWWYKDDHNQGNGGFSIRSTRLLKHLSGHRDRYPPIVEQFVGEDQVVCRRYRTALEADGFQFASNELAAEFSFEHIVKPAFGFHGLWNLVHFAEEDTVLGMSQLFRPYHFNREDMQRLMLNAICKKYYRLAAHLLARTMALTQSDKRQ